MLGTRLIFVDGLPGSGKSTTAALVASELERRGIPCRLLREREISHPLNVGPSATELPHARYWLFAMGRRPPDGDPLIFFRGRTRSRLGS